MVPEFSEYASAGPLGVMVFVVIIFLAFIVMENRRRSSEVKSIVSAINSLTTTTQQTLLFVLEMRTRILGQTPPPLDIESMIGGTRGYAGGSAAPKAPAPLQEE